MRVGGRPFYFWPRIEPDEEAVTFIVPTKIDHIVLRTVSSMIVIMAMDCYTAMIDETNNHWKI